MRPAVSLSVRLLATWLLGLMACVGVFAQAGGRAGEVSFVAGRVWVGEGSAARVLKVGDVLVPGDRLRTGAGGHLHIKTVDGGFLALRPSSQARIDVFDYDPAQPEATRIRLVLDSGVMRAVSGSGAQAARDKFRLNTPVAAIGIRGTDFTVSTTDSVTRVAVQKGEIVLSPFSASCLADALGPCTGASMRALSADQAGRLLELYRGQPEPRLIEVRPNGGNAPDQTAPPAPSEPRTTSTAPAPAPTSAAPAAPAPLPTVVAPAPVSAAAPSPAVSITPVATAPSLPTVSPSLPTVSPSLPTASASLPALSPSSILSPVSPVSPVVQVSPTASPAPTNAMVLASEARNSAWVQTTLRDTTPVVPQPPVAPEPPPVVTPPVVPEPPPVVTPPLASEPPPVVTPPVVTPPVAPEPPPVVTPPVAPEPPPVVAPPPAPEPPPPVLTWGRWAAIAGQPAPVSSSTFIAQYGKRVAMNRLFLLSVSNAENLRMPETGTFAFALAGGEAWTLDNGTVSGAAQVLAGQLSVNFGTQRFTTSLDIDALGTQATLKSQGRLTADGLLSGNRIYSGPDVTMSVSGALGGADATTAAYVFDGPVSATRSVVGAVHWKR